MTPPETELPTTRPAGADRARVLGWTLALVGSALLLLGGWLLVRLVENGPKPAYLDTGAPAAVEHGAPKPANLLRLAGSGSNLPLTRLLANAFVARRPWLRVRVHESIGSSGGIRATSDRAIEIGLISRSLGPSEAERGLIALPYARVAVVIAANPSVPVRGIDRQELLDLFAGRREHWADGSPVVLLQREPGDSSHLAVYAAIPAFEAVDRDAWQSGRGRKLFHDRAMQEALISTPGAIGLFDQGLALIQDLPIIVLEFDGLRPTQEAVLGGRYPLFKDLSFVLPDDEADPLALEFITFVYSPEAQQIIRDNGYVPLDPPAQSTFAHLRAVGPPPRPASDDTEDTGGASADTETDEAAELDQ